MRSPVPGDSPRTIPGTTVGGSRCRATGEHNENRQSILLEGTPQGIDLDELRAEIVSAPRIASVHDLHVWSLGAEDLVLSCHVVVTESSMDAAEHLVRDLEVRICDRFGIRHTTIQAESCCPCEEDCAAGIEPHNHPHPHLELSQHRN